MLPLMFHLIKTTVLPLMFHLIKTTVLPFTFHLIKTTVLPLIFFFPWWLMKNNSVTPYILFDRDKYIFFSWKFFFMTTDKKRQCYPLCLFSWRPIKTTVLHLMFFPCWPIKNDSGTPYVFFPWRQIKNNSDTPYVFSHDDQ